MNSDLRQLVHLRPLVRYRGVPARRRHYRARIDRAIVNFVINNKEDSHMGTTTLADIGEAAIAWRTARKAADPVTRRENHAHGSGAEARLLRAAEMEAERVLNERADEYEAQQQQ